MPNQLTGAGLVTKTKTELVTEFTDTMKLIYGVDINLDQNTEDGQMMMLFLQAVLDNLDLVKQVYNSFDPDNAFGVTLDKRVAFNGIQRQKGTASEIMISIVTNRALSIVGSNQDKDNAYKVQDSTGAEWILIETQNFSSAGTYLCRFRSASFGPISAAPNTINIPKTVILGIESVNNPNSVDILGVPEESDYELRLRRQKSVSLASQGYLAGLVAALENIEGISDVYVYENNSNVTNPDGVPAHSIWVIVGGNYDPALVADAIYKKRNAGCGMYGDISFTVTQIDGSPFVIQWDEVVVTDIWLKVILQSLDGVTPVNYGKIKAELPDKLVFGLNEKADISALTAAIKEIDENAVVMYGGFMFDPAHSPNPILAPPNKKTRLAIVSSQIILTPIIITPAAKTVGINETINFTAIGGVAPLTFEISNNVSGGTIDPVTGEYESGAVLGTDTVRVWDSNYNESFAIIEVV